MVELHHIFALLYAGAALVALAVAWVAWRRRPARGAIWLGILLLGIAIWSGGTAAMWHAATLREQVFWQSMMDLGTWMVPVGALILAFDIARMESWRTPRRVALISSASFALANIEWINPGHLYAKAYLAHTVGPHTHYEVIPGPLYWAFPVFAYTLIVVGLIIISRVYLRSSGAERTQAATLLMGGLLPLVAVAVTLSGFVPLAGLGLAPLAFLATGFLWWAAILRGTLLDILPMARNALVEQMLAGVLVIDGQDNVVDANPAVLTLLHKSLAEVLGKPAGEILGGVRGATAVLRGSGPRRAVLPMDSDGDSRYVALGITSLSASLGGLPPQLITLHDVTEDRRAHERLELARTVFDSTNDGIVVTLPDAGQMIIDVNDAYCRLTGRSREDAVGKDIGCFQSDRHSPEFYQAMHHTLLSTGAWEGEVWQTRVDGTVFPSWLSLSVIKDDQQEVRHAVGIFMDITGIMETERLRYAATHDALTGLPNRFLLNDRLEHDLAFARRAGTGLTVLFVDLDAFKGVNDALGHGRGDALLVEVAGRVVSVLRESDTVGRLSGDEFIVVIADTNDPPRVEGTARRLLEALASPCHLGTEDVHVTASIGVALFPKDGMEATSLIHHADLAMYSAKRSGGNRIEFFSEELHEDL
jgi:diguanylate cyclase (GGDEF)-like protein/PAS domain S-box-containing protein